MQPTEQPRTLCRRLAIGLLKVVAALISLAAVCLLVDTALPRLTCRPGSWSGPVSDHFDGEHFHNGRPAAKLHASWKKWLADRPTRGEYPRTDRNEHTPQLAPRVEGAEWEATLVNHSTFLLRTAGQNILTDPVWSDYTSPVQFAGPKRCRPVGIEWDALPRIDVCFLSHNHYDHFDADTLRRLTKRDNPLYIVPLGLKSLLLYHCGPVRCIELDWWQSHTYNGITYTLTPAHHWSNRYKGSAAARRSLWGGLYLTSPGGPSLYFVGDSAASPFFADIRRRLGSPDLALIPIGAYHPDWIKNNHMGPYEAVDCFRTLSPRLALACHFGTWQLANEGYQETLDDLASALRLSHIPPHLFLPALNGQTFRGKANYMHTTTDSKQ